MGRKCQTCCANKEVENKLKDSIFKNSILASEYDHYRPQLKSKLTAYASPLKSSPDDDKNLTKTIKGSNYQTKSPTKSKNISNTFGDLSGAGLP